jgi:demethylmenaquinone methyltransferase/2-methoxy-6-polyprenyl-1,4-benzoquinol methylase
VGHEPLLPPDPLLPHPPLTRYYQDGHARRGWVDRMFDSTARHYDWINRVMSFGSGVWYRREALKRVGVGPGAAVLDVCVGTGLVARAAHALVGPTGRVVGLDASLGMLFAAQRVLPFPLVQGYVERLPLADQSFDFVTMGYALRHVADLRAVFAEYRRVLRPGGRLLILEFSRPQSRLRYRAVRFYLRTVVPAVARLGGRDARTIMRYFWDTIESCVPPETILAALAAAGLAEPARFVQADLFSEYSATRPS